MLPILQIGPLAVQVPGLIILVGLWIGLSLSERYSDNHNVNPNLLYNLSFVGLISGIIGSRLAYVARFPSAFFDNPISLISLNPGLLDPIGGIFLGLIVAVVYGQRKKMHLWSTMDALTPALGALAIAIGFANLASGNSFGAPTNVPWSIELFGARRHPTQIYQIISSSIILLMVWPGFGLTDHNNPGVRFFSFLAMSSAASLVIEAFGGDSIIITTGIRQDQVVAWFILALSLYGLGQRLKFSSKTSNPETR